MKKLGLQVTRAARADLTAIARCTAKRWGDVQAAKYLRQLDSRFKALSRDVELGRGCEDILPGCWRITEGRHVIFYLHDEDSVTILRVLHERMLPTRHLK